jgi:hypothetical protein
MENEAYELSLMKQGYDKGAVYFIRKIPGVFEYTNMDSMYHFEQEKGTGFDNIYIATRYKFAAAPHHANHIHKIDVFAVVPKQNWHSYYTTSTGSGLFY